MRLLQITASATRAQATTQNLYASVLIITATAGNFLGDDTVTTTNGVPLSATAPLVIYAPTPRGIPLNSLWVVGATGTANILYEPSA
jgi:hypothetical protein